MIGLNQRMTIEKNDWSEDFDADLVSFFSNFSNNAIDVLQKKTIELLGYTELVMSNDLCEQNQQEILNEIRNKGFDLLNKFLSIKEFTSALNRTHKISFNEIEISNVVDEIRNRFQPICMMRGLKLEITQSNDIQVIQSDWELLNKVINNIVENAIKFTLKGGISIKFDVNSTGEFEITIKDSGIGIPKRYLESIFKPFFKIYTNKVENDGIGIGLSLVKADLSLLGGRIQCDSDINGSNFYIMLKKKQNSSLLEKKMPGWQSRL